MFVRVAIVGGVDVGDLYCTGGDGASVSCRDEGGADEDGVGLAIADVDCARVEHASTGGASLGGTGILGAGLGGRVEGNPGVNGAGVLGM